MQLDSLAARTKLAGIRSLDITVLAGRGQTVIRHARPLAEKIRVLGHVKIPEILRCAAAGRKHRAGLEGVTHAADNLPAGDIDGVAVRVAQDKELVLLGIRGG